MKYFINKLYCFLKFFLLILFIGYYGSITAFYHSHLVYGNVISHSHPYKHNPFNKSPFESHSHSSAAYNLIQQLNETNWNSSPGLSQIPEPIEFYVNRIFICHTVHYSSISYSLAQLRAPPIVG